VHDFKVGDLVIEIPARARRHARKPLIGVVTGFIGNVILKVQFASGHEELAAITTVDRLSNDRDHKKT
jgi:hypothetical protein